VGIWVKILQVPYHILFPLILVFMLVGSFSINRSIFDIWILIGFGIFGYIAKLLDFPLVPITLTVILGPILEKSLRQSLQMSGGSLGILFRSPASTAFILIALVIILVPIGLAIFRKVRKVKKNSILKVIAE
jgi:putative tricarboxylic transport membrane protein